MRIIERGQFSGRTKGKKRGWVIGHMAKGLLRINNVEVKWASEAKSKAGMNEWRCCERSKDGCTISVLIRGKFRMQFRKKHERERTVILKKTGSYVAFRHGVEHRSEALKNSLFLTIRWPSIKHICNMIEPADQARKSSP